MQKRTRILSFLLFACGVFSGLLLTHSQANAQNGIPEGYVAKNMQAVGYLEMEPPFKLAIQEVEGRWYLYTGHLWAHGWSIIDVTEPTAPKLLKFIEGPENTWTIQMEVEDGKMITALQNQAERWGGNPAQPFEEGFLTCWATMEDLTFTSAPEACRTIGAAFTKSLTGKRTRWWAAGGCPDSAKENHPRALICTARPTLWEILPTFPFVERAWSSWTSAT